MPDYVRGLLEFIDASPTPYHAVASCARRLEAAGFRRADETDLWRLEPGDRLCAVRGGGSLFACAVGAHSPVDAGFRLLGAHTDSPNLRIRPRSDVRAHGYRQLAVEPYGGILLHSWLDRDLSIAGRVTLRGDGGPRTRLLDFERPLLRIPNLAIHLQREIHEQGLKLNPQQHALPVAGLEDAPPLEELVVGVLRARGLADARAEDVLAYDLMLHDTQSACVAGTRGEFIHAPRLDNLASCHAALEALLVAADVESSSTRGIVLYDHEEIGSRTAEGAQGTLLPDALERVASGFKGGEPQGLPRALARSTLLSVDMAHAVHPSFADRHDPGHRPLLGGGPVLKVNANRSYASDSETGGLFAHLCAQEGVALQHFVSRSDLLCGSTIGPIAAARAGLRTADVGNPMLSMHSCREMAGTADVEPMIRVLRAFLAS